MIQDLGLNVGINKTEPPTPQELPQFPDDDFSLALVAAFVGAINIALLLVLFIIYISNYRKLKSSFSMGLALFAVLLVMQNVLFIFFLVSRQGFHGPGMGAPVLSLNIIQLSALIVLLKITWV